MIAASVGHCSGVQPTAIAVLYHSAHGVSGSVVVVVDVVVEVVVLDVVLVVVVAIASVVLEVVLVVDPVG